MIYIDKTYDINGTSLQGYITITLADLVDVLGEVHYSDGDKTTAEWAFKTLDGTVLTIYDYKEDVTPTHAYAWHIGGAEQNVLEVVKQLFPNHVVEAK